MNRLSDPRIERMLADMRRAYELTQEHQPEEGLKLYREVLKQAQGLTLESAYLLWSVAVAADYSGDLEMAFTYVVQAVETDPLTPPFRNSFEVISNRLRAALADPARPADDASTPRLCELLTRAGEADVATHLALVRFHAATGDTGKATELVQAVTLLFPAAREAWICAAELASARGDAETAARCTAEAALLEGDPVPFAVPGVARG
ncbi:hypothetical protein [Anaeromyxobacter paludicola]|uniref:Tetratricopeptide repeat protein n=1 Tax=Anaeromyxobacter paludicola TaxID=2918171 RepID=A0ABM7X9U4_9BACT|nr:hypothetical protein [Anaeromyxobacter paludicola]BDG08603.1 hypothetical protein AMPC_17160 [Anaeromyxobacter paludicola]